MVYGNLVLYSEHSKFRTAKLLFRVHDGVVNFYVIHGSKAISYSTYYLECVVDEGEIHFFRMGATIGVAQGGQKFFLTWELIGVVSPAASRVSGYHSLTNDLY